MILDEYVELKVSPSKAKYYENLGYEVPKRYNKESYRTVYDLSKTFKVKVRDLPNGSSALIHVGCDICGRERIMKYSNYLKSENNHGYYACKDCAAYKRRDNIILSATFPLLSHLSHSIITKMKGRFK